jgi:hypothetical protein
VVSGDNCWVAGRNLQILSLPNEIDLAIAGAPDTSIVRRNQIPFTTNVDLVFPLTNDNGVPVPAGNYEFRLYFNDSQPVITRLPLTVLDYVAPPFPFVGDAQNGISDYYVFYPMATPSLSSTDIVMVVKGKVTLGGSWHRNGGGSGPQNVTFQFMLNDTPVGPPVFAADGNPTLSFDTTTVPDGTYMLTAKFIDCNDVFHADLGGKWNAYQLRPFPISFIVMNVGAKDPTQNYSIPTIYFAENNRQDSTAIDYVQYKGIPQPAAPYPYPGPGQSVVFAPPVYSSSSSFHGNPMQLRNQSNWYMEGVTENRYHEYKGAPQFWTTKLGGVCAGGWSTKNGGTLQIETSYAPVSRNSYRDGGRNSNMSSSLVNFVATPTGGSFSAHWTGIQLDGRLFTVALDGTITTIAGPKRDLTKLPLDYSDGTNPEFPNTVQVGTIDSNPLYTFSDFGGGANDLCWDPRNPNVCYVAQTLDHCIIKVDFTPNSPYGPTNPLCRRYAGYKGGILGDGVGGFANGPALSTGTNGAQFNGIYSICMQKRTDIPGHPQGTMYVADNYNGLIRMISADGATVSTLVGTHGGAMPPAGTDANPFGFLNNVLASTTQAVISITSNGDGTAAVVLSMPSIVTSVGWKVTIQVNGQNYLGGGNTYENDTFGIYTVSSFTDSQHFSVVMGPVPSSGTITAFIIAFDTYSSPTRVSFANAYTAYPQVVRMSSAGDIVLGESWYNLMLRRIWLSGPNANTITRIGPFGNLAQYGGPAFGWLDVDDVGACGPVDDIVMFKTDSNPGAASVIYRWSIDGSYNGQFGGDGGPDFPAEGLGGGGHYPWAFAFSKTQARHLSMGESDTGMFSWRPVQSGDPDRTIDEVIGGSGFRLFHAGTIPSLPVNLRPSFAALYGYSGTHHFGDNVLPTFDDLQARYPTDAGLAAFIQGGMGGAIPRPEFSINDDVSPPVFGRDLRDMIYFVRRMALSGSYPTQILPGTASLDFVRPAVSNIVATRVSSTSIRVSWNTNKNTIGMIAAGSPYSQNPSWNGPYPYNIWSPLETTYGTTHTVTIAGLPDVAISGNGPTHYAVVCKDKAGNWARSPDVVIS